MGTPLPVVPDGIRVKITQKLGDDVNIENIMYGVVASGSLPLTNTTALALANAAFAAWVAGPLQYQGTDVTLESVTITDLSVAGGVEVVSTTAAHAGLGSTASLTASASMVVTLLTGTRGRSSRGRIYIAGMTPGDQATPQTWTSAIVTAMGNAMNTFGADMLAAATATNMVVCSFYSGKIPNPNPLSNRRNIPDRRGTPQTTIITSYEARARIGSQRRRWAS
jgi:hypothetical protein